MSKTLAAARFELGLEMWAEETTRPDAGGGTAATVGSLWQQISGSLIQTFLKVDTPDTTGWVLQNLVNLQIFNVQAYGAVGDGVTDDTAAINAAITAAVSAGGGGVYFPGVNVASGKSYKVTKPASQFGSFLLNAKPLLFFFGDGPSSKLAMIGSAALGDWYMFRAFNGSNHLVWWNLAFDGSGITNPDPNDQNHFIQLEGRAADVVGVSDVEISECFFGPIVGDMVRCLSSFPAVVEDVRVLNNAQDSNHCRSFIEAQRGSKRVVVMHNWMWGSDDQDIDFEPTGGGSNEGPEEWVAIGNMVDHQSRNTSSITMSGIGSAQPTQRSIFAYNVIINGGQVEGLSLSGILIAGNIVRCNNATADGVILCYRLAQDISIEGNVVTSDTAVSGRPAIRLAANTDHVPQRCAVTDNICVTNESTCISLEVRETVIEGNLCQLTQAALTSAINGINDASILDDIDHVMVTGNMVIAANANMSSGIRFHAQSGFVLRNSAAVCNYVHGCSNGVVWDRATTETITDWRGAMYNLISSSTSGPVAVSPSTVAVAIDGNAGPGTQADVINLAAGPDGNALAPKGSFCMNTQGGQASTLFYKDAGAANTNTPWARDGADELQMGALASSVATAARFLAPGGMGLATESATEIKWAVPRPGTIRNLRIKNVAGVGAGTVTFTLRKNGVDTTVTVAYANTATSGSDTTHSFTVVAGDLISLSVAKDTIPGTPQSLIQAVFELTA